MALPELMWYLLVGYQCSLTNLFPQAEQKMLAQRMQEAYYLNCSTTPNLLAKMLAGQVLVHRRMAQVYRPNCSTNSSLLVRRAEKMQAHQKMLEVCRPS